MASNVGPGKLSGRASEPISHVWRDERGNRVRFTWIEGSRVGKFSPFTQAYAVAFERDGGVIIGHRPGHPWCLPGGTHEAGETARQTLVRELDEELSLRVVRARLLGAQLVEYLDEAKAPHYQLRYVAIVDLKALTPDPDNGFLWERRSVKPGDVNRYLRWGPVLDRILLSAKRQYAVWSREDASRKRRSAK
ncbi:TPA: NUDIX domain-containing protein [Candidatus Woesearchaeota archaeon]|nr:NUDIX domain-containing protein [Candidatus Woesearchaeota archaeon]